MDRDRLIQDYIFNRLSEDEKRVFQRLIHEDSGFKEEVELAVDMNVALNELDAELLRKDFKEIETRQNSTSYKILKNVFIAIMVILTILGLYYLFNRTPQQNIDAIYAAYYYPPTNTYYPVTRDVGDKAPFAQAFLNYEQKKYNEAANHFAEIEELDNDPFLQFYYAISLIEIGQYGKAMQLLSKIETKDAYMEEDIVWYKALILLAQDNPSSALEALNTIPNFKQAKRNQLKKELMEIGM